jgi:hypothetical protein
MNKQDSSYDLCTTYETIMEILRSLPDDFEVDFDRETIREFLLLLYTIDTIHRLFHAHNPFLSRN